MEEYDRMWEEAYANVNEAYVHCHTAAGLLAQMKSRRDRDKQEVLTQEQWDLLSAAESRIYADDHGGMHTWTSCNVREESWHIVPLWYSTMASVDAEMEFDEHSTNVQVMRSARMRRTAHRLALALRLLAFGPDSIIR